MERWERRRTTDRSIRRVVTACLAAVLVVAVAAPAASAGGQRHRAPSVPGMVIVESDRSADETWDTLLAALDTNPNITRIATIDHGAAAASVGLELDSNRVAVFGNPALGSPLMAENQVVGLDLPQKLQVFEWRGRVWVGFNDATYLEARHDLGDLPQLDTIAGALRTLSGIATGRDVDERSFRFQRFRSNPATVTVPSDAGFDETYERLRAAIGASPASIAFEVNHQAGAAGVGIDLRPTRLVVFGNPQLGTPLMQSRPTAGIDLPLKFLIWEDEDGRTQVTTNDVSLLRTRHRLRNRQLASAETAIENFLTAATSGPITAPTG